MTQGHKGKARGESTANPDSSAVTVWPRTLSPAAARGARLHV